MLLIEAMLSLSILTVLGLILLKLSINILQPRQWTLQSTLSDAYMTYERAYAERIPFDDLLATNSPWPVYPQTATSSVEVGRLPGGQIVTGQVTRTRHQIESGAVGTEVTNPLSMKIWRAQSVLSYKVGGRPYVKSRSVVRSQ